MDQVVEVELEYMEKELLDLMEIIILLEEQQVVVEVDQVVKMV